MNGEEKEAFYSNFKDLAKDSANLMFPDTNKIESLFIKT